jgi:hypothetical protein
VRGNPTPAVAATDASRVVLDAAAPAAAAADAKGGDADGAPTAILLETVRRIREGVSEDRPECTAKLTAILDVLKNQDGSPGTSTARLGILAPMVYDAVLDKELPPEYGKKLIEALAALCDWPGETLSRDNMLAPRMLEKLVTLGGHEMGGWLRKWVRSGDLQSRASEVDVGERVFAKKGEVCGGAPQLPNNPHLQKLLEPEYRDILLLHTLNDVVTGNHTATTGKGNWHLNQDWKKSGVVESDNPNSLLHDFDRILHLGSEVHDGRPHFDDNLFVVIFADGKERVVDVSGGQLTIAPRYTELKFHADNRSGKNGQCILSFLVGSEDHGEVAKDFVVAVSKDPAEREKDPDLIIECKNLGVHMATAEVLDPSNGISTLHGSRMRSKGNNRDAIALSVVASLSGLPRGANLADICYCVQYLFLASADEKAAVILARCASEGGAFFMRLIQYASEVFTLYILLFVMFTSKIERNNQTTSPIWHLTHVVFDGGFHTSRWSR